MVVHDIPKNWVRKEHIAPLKALLYSNEKSIAGYLKNAGYGSGAYSTIGEEVSLLLESLFYGTI